MKLNRLSILFSCLLSISLFSCEDDFDPNADYQETAVIYAMLDRSQPVQYIKVNKAFLNTNSNAITIAANNPDSTRFYDDIEVKIEKLRLAAKDTIVENAFVLSPVQVTNKEPGAFYYPEQIAYASQPNEINFDDNELVRVVVTNLTSNKVYSAATRIVNFFCVNGVGYSAGTINCGQPDAPVPITPTQPLAIDFMVAQNAGIYKGSYHIFYMEINGTDTVHKTTEYVALPNLVISNTTERTNVLPNALFEHLSKVIDTSNDLPTTKRKFKTGTNILVEITGGGKELQKYIDVNNSYSAITQTRPFYSNVRNGVGLVSSRYTHLIPGVIKGAVIGKEPNGSDKIENVIAKLNALYPELKFVE